MNSLDLGAVDERQKKLKEVPDLLFFFDLAKELGKTVQPITPRTQFHRIRLLVRLCQD